MLYPMRDESKWPIDIVINTISVTSGESTFKREVALEMTGTEWAGGDEGIVCRGISSH